MFQQRRTPTHIQNANAGLGGPECFPQQAAHYQMAFVSVVGSDQQLDPFRELHQRGDESVGTGGRMTSGRVVDPTRCLGKRAASW